MAYLVAAIVIVGVIALLNMLLVVGVIRRLREHGERLLAFPGPGMMKMRADVGAPVGDFTATTTDGGTIERGGLTAETLVGVFSPTCEPCQALLPAFVDYAAMLPGGRDQVIAVVSGDAAKSDRLVAALSPVARVIVESDQGATTKAFDVMAFPSLFVVDGDARIAASGGRIDEIRRPVPAATR